MIFKGNKDFAVLAGTITGAVSAFLAPIVLEYALITKPAYKFTLRNMFNNITLLTYSLYKFYWGNPFNHKPAVVMAGIPFGTVEEVSHAMSDETLKYRATGGIFLAHQEGGEQTLRIIGKAFGQNRFMFLNMLDLLFLYGSSRAVDLFNKAPGFGSAGLDVPPLTTAISSNPWQQIENMSTDQGTTEAHLTFPVITRQRIYTNMYIETYDFSESIEGGLNVITYTVFLRKFVPPLPMKYARSDNGRGTPTWHYAADEGNSYIKKFKTIDAALERGLTGVLIAYRFFQFLGENSPETGLAHISNINLMIQKEGDSETGTIIATKVPEITYDLKTLNSQQKAELMCLG